MADRHQVSSSTCILCSPASLHRQVGFHEDDPGLVSAFYMYRWGMFKERMAGLSDYDSKCLLIYQGSLPLYCSQIALFGAVHDIPADRRGTAGAHLGGACRGHAARGGGVVCARRGARPRPRAADGRDAASLLFVSQCVDWYSGFGAADLESRQCRRGRAHFAVACSNCGIPP